jgi:cell wall-associated NlpC family hydrolase
LNILKKTLVLSALSAIAALGTTASAVDLSGWAISEYQSANAAGLCSYAVVSNSMTDNITRQEFCELAVNLYKKLTNDYDLMTPTVSPFTDTDNVAVSQAYCYGLVSGTGDDTFTPDRLVTREEMAKMLVSTLTASESRFSLSDGSDTSAIDAFDDGYKVSDWAKASVITTLNYSLMNGVTSDTFSPSGATTREQAIASINRSYLQFGDGNGYTLAAPVITLPTEDAQIEDSEFTVEWTATSGAVKYIYAIKDSDGDAVARFETTDTSAVVSSSKLKSGNNYSVIVGAVLKDGSECYSLPVDFKYKAAKSSSSSGSEYVATNPKAQALIDTAAKYLGVPYVWGGTSPSGFDCSGFVQYVCNENGISITRVADDQFRTNGTSVSKSQLEPGDLVFFGSGGYVTHVGMYVGDGMMIHAPSTGKNVMYTSIESDYYTSRYMGAKRVY